MKYSHTIQHENYDCGYAVIETVLKRFNINHNYIENKIEKYDTSKKQEYLQGLSLLTIKKILYSYGIKSECYKVENFKKLSFQKMPIITRVSNNGIPHYIVIHKIKSNKILISDPSEQNIKYIRLSDFRKIFTGYVICLDKNQKHIQKNNQKTFSSILLNKIIKEITLFEKIKLSICLILTFILPIFLTQFLALLLENYLSTLNLINFSVLIIISAIFLIIFYQSLNFIVSEQINLKNNIQNKIINSFYINEINNIDSKNDIDSISAYFWNTLTAIQGLINKFFLTYYLIYVIFLIIMLFIYNQVLAFILILWCLIITIFLKKYAVKISNKFQENLKSSNLYASTFVKFIQSNFDLKAFNYEKNAIEDLNNEMNSYFRKNLDYAKTVIRFQTFIQGSITGMMISLIAVYIYLYNHSQITISSEIDSGIYLLFIITSGFSMIFNEYIGYVQSKNSIEYLNRKKFFKDKEQPTIKEKKYKTIQKININNLVFSYKNKNIYYPNITFKNDKVNIINGGNGVGKSTLLKIISGMIIPKSGNISIQLKGENINIKNLSNNISFYSNEMTLFDQTVLNNSIFNVFSKKYTSNYNKNKYKELKSKLKIDLPDNHMISYQGENISLGQKQKILILRTLLEDKPIYLFDEPTSNLDKNSKLEFYKIIQSLVSNKKIIIIITHDDFLKVQETNKINIKD